MAPVKMVIADDHRLMLDAIRIAFEHESDIEIVGEAQSGTEVLPLVNQTKPDVLLLDVIMPGVDGLRCLELLRQRHPDVKTIMLSGSEDPGVIDAAFQRGAKAFVLKHIDPRDLPAAVRQTLGASVIYPHERRDRPTEATAAETVGLTQREASILDALASGLSNKQIAKELWLAEQTVKFHLTNIYRKFNVTSRTEAIRFAYRNGLVTNPVLENGAGQPWAGTRTVTCG